MRENNKKIHKKYQQNSDQMTSIEIGRETYLKQNSSVARLVKIIS